MKLLIYIYIIYITSCKYIYIIYIIIHHIYSTQTNVVELCFHSTFYI